MKLKALLLSAALLPLALAAQETGKEQKEGKEMKEAKDNVSRAEKVEMKTEEMVAQLGLNEEQAAKVKEVNERYAAEMKTTKPEDSAPTARRTRMEDIRKRRDAELQGILTPEQFTRMMEMRKERKAEGGGAPAPGKK